VTKLVPPSLPPVEPPLPPLPPVVPLEPPISAPSPDAPASSSSLESELLHAFAASAVNIAITTGTNCERICVIGLSKCGAPKKQGARPEVSTGPDPGATTRQAGGAAAWAISLTLAVERGALRAVEMVTAELRARREARPSSG
jgi:hypothetical protein